MAYDSRKQKKAVRPNKRDVDTTELRRFLDTLEVGVDPSIHVNGPSFSTALLCVDFGQPLQQARLTPEETTVLSDHLRELARTMIGAKTGTIRINHDGPHGVYWASFS